MMGDIKSSKDGVSYVLVFKFSRFGRNAADVLSFLQVMQDFGVNLVCVEVGIDSSKDAGKWMVSVLPAVAEIERENIRVQTLEGCIQKAREGRWNGGFASYLVSVGRWKINSLDPDDRHYVRRKTDLDDRLYKMYDKIEDTESLLIAARVKKQAVEAEKLTGDNIYKVLIYFDKLYDAMNEQEQRQIMEALISEIQIYEERRPNSQWLKSIKFRLPVIEEDMNISLDDEEQVETVCLLFRLNAK